MNSKEHVLVTGGAGFIGSHLCETLLEQGRSVTILDNLDPFYDVAIKEQNLARLQSLGKDLRMVRGDIRDPDKVREAMEGVSGVIHLAALAGVRPSLERPTEYWSVNLVGTQTLLDALKGRPEVPFVFGSSSSIYGGNEKVPFHEEDPVDEPVSPYAATKKAGELCCRVFHHLYGNPVSCLRFFTVYGPRQRPEMAIHKFTRLIDEGKKIPMFGDGESSRDYTFVSDIVKGVVASLDRRVDPGDPSSGFRIYNLGGSATTTLKGLIDRIASALGKEALIEQLPMQPGDVLRTFADVSRAEKELGFQAEVPIDQGIPLFVDWYRENKGRTQA
ncbi:MAG TPA: SDR family NAD(P)-dependent oxidoreductase [Planctomycetes bacterium]|nr:SDR family NAD(P)-dependent oxidoreductase [Planctomycetota bacterium]